ncbi:MAG: hypothetical protein QOH68_1633 [Nocardioidaceae bacterium]|nr:hypothetical protein [Nocardioidaceae bacterium]
MRLFVAVWPPADVIEQLAAIERPAIDGVRWTTAEQWHVTLRFLGSIDDPAPVIDALEAADLATTEAVIGPAAVALGRGVLCLPIAGLDDLAATVLASTAAMGQPPEHRRFRGHLTLARVRQGSARRLAGAPLAARFPVRSVQLVRSNLHPEGARYETVHEVSVEGA